MIFGNRRWNPAGMSVLSLYPATKQIRMRHQGHTYYEFPECHPDHIRIAEPTYLNPINEQQAAVGEMVVEKCEPGEGYSILRVYDTAQIVLDPVSERNEAKPIPVEIVAEDLARIFGRGFLVLNGETPTKTELESARQAINSQMLQDFGEGQDYHSKGQSAKIRNYHRLAAKWLGREDAPWFRGAERKVMKQCVACGEEILALALVCKHCGTNLPNFYKTMKMKPDEVADPVVYRVFQEKMQFVQKATPRKTKAEIKAEVAAKLDESAERRRKKLEAAANPEQPVLVEAQEEESQ